MSTYIKQINGYLVKDEEARSDISTLKNKAHTHSNKSVLDGITAIDSSLSSTSTNPVQNKVIYSRIVNMQADIDTISDNLDSTVDRVAVLENSSGSSSGDYLPLAGGTMNGLITFAANDTYGIVPATSNYCKIGNSSKYFYQAYINNIYVGKIYAASSSSSSTKSYGTAGQVLTSNGSGSLYWSTPSSGSSITVDSSLSSSSTNPVQNKVVYNEIMSALELIQTNDDRITALESSSGSSSGSSYNMATQLYSGSTTYTTFSNYSPSKGGMVIINGRLTAESDGYGNFQFVFPIYATSGTITLSQCVYGYETGSGLRVTVMFSLSAGSVRISVGSAVITSAYQVY